MKLGTEYMGNDIQTFIKRDLFFSAMKKLKMLMGIGAFAASISLHADLPDNFEYLDIQQDPNVYEMLEYLSISFPEINTSVTSYYELEDKVNEILHNNDEILVSSFEGENNLIFADIIEHQRYTYHIEDSEIAALLADELPWNAIFYSPTHGTGDVWSDSFISKRYTGEYAALMNITTEPIHFDPHEAIHLWQLKNKPEDVSTVDMIRFFEFQALAGDLALSPYVEHDDSIENIKYAMDIRSKTHGQYPAGQFFREYFEEQNIGYEDLDDLSSKMRRLHGIELLKLGNNIGIDFNHMYR